MGRSCKVVVGLAKTPGHLGHPGGDSVGHQQTSRSGTSAERFGVEGNRLSKAEAKKRMIEA